MLGEATERTKPYTCGSQCWKAITESVMHFMAKEMIPISTVEKPGFLSMVMKLDPQYEVPSRKHYSIYTWDIINLKSILVPLNGGSATTKIFVTFPY